MATYTTNMGLKKPAGDENMNIGDINGNMDDIDAAITNDRKGIAIISKGNTHAAISSGQYVYVHNHSTLPDGLYKATSAISANGTLSTSNLSSVSSGGFNDVLTLLAAKVNTTDRVIIDRNRNTSLADCNEVTDPGMYRLISSTANRPSEISYGILIHIVSNDYINQLVINTSGSILMFRGKSSGSWTAWRRVVTVDDILNFVNKTDTTQAVSLDSETRFYVYFNGNTSGGTKPWSNGNNGHLITFVRDSSNTVLQFAKAQSATDFKIYMRLKNAGTWGAWKSITFT